MLKTPAHYRPGLDLVRLAALLPVLCYHFCIEASRSGFAVPAALIGRGMADWVEVGLAWFFLLSGAALCLQWQDRFAWRPYLAGRAAAMYPAFWLGFAVLFLARTQAALYFILTIDNEAVRTRSRKQVLWNAIPFVVFFLWFLAAIFTGEGYAIGDNGSIVLEKYKYFRNLVEMPLNAILFLLGVAGVLYGILRTVLSPRWRKGIWFAGAGTLLAVFGLLIIAGFNGTAFYPSSTDIQSSLTIYNASSSLYTLKAMSWVSLAIPFVAAYIWYAWRALTRKPMDAKELEEAENKY